MAGYIGSKTVNLSTTGADIAGDADVSGDLTVDTSTLHVDSANNRVGIGTTSPSSKVTVEVDDFDGVDIKSTVTNKDPILSLTSPSNNYWNMQLDASSSDQLQWRYNNSTKMLLDSSGNLLVGKTSTATGAGFEARSDGQIVGTRSANRVAFLNRLTSDGDIVQFAKDGTPILKITNISSTLRASIAGTNGSTGVGIYFANSQILPTLQDGSVSDNTADLGNISYRWDDVYATNGTIVTSDRNEKQDIAELDEAEKRVAVACKGLIRKYRWKDAVAEKGDDARIHVGIIAQDLKAAFEAEGLDAGRYAMFISSTWWETQTEVPAVEAVAEVLDDDGNVVTEAVEAVDAYTRTDTYETQEEAPEGATERTRLGVRYSELLAFIIGAL